MLRRVAPALALAVLLAPGCAPSPPPGDAAPPATPAHGGRFVYPLRADPPTLDFVSCTDMACEFVARLVADSLVDHDVHLKIVPRLATAWDLSDGGRTLTFHLRPGVRFHDGAPLTSADVRFTYERVVDPKSRALVRLDPLLPVERLETPDPLTVRVVYRYPYAPALHGWDLPILPRHLYGTRDPAAARYDRAPVGSGPFRFVSWEPGRRIVLRANPDYWDGPPYLDELVFQVIPSQETTLQSLLAGEVDYAPLTPTQWEAQEDRASFARRFRPVRYTPLFYYYIAWRCDGSNPFFADARVRRAMTLALDREGYVRSMLRGLGEVASSPFHPAVGGADPALPPLPFDPAGAAALLDEAGWRPDPGTGIRTRGGVPFRFTLLIFAGGEDHLQFSQVAQESLRRLGVEMEIQRLDWPTLLSRLRAGEFQAALSGTVPRVDPDGARDSLHSSQIDGGQNYAAFRDPEVDAWLETARRSLDPQERSRLYHLVDRRVRDRQPYAYLFYPVVQSAVARRFGNVEASPRGILACHPGAARFYTGPGSPR